MAVRAKEIIKDLVAELDDLSELSGLSYKSKLKERVEQFLWECDGWKLPQQRATYLRDRV